MAPLQSPAPTQAPRSSAVASINTLITHNPALFYTVLVLCCLSLVCGVTYLVGSVTKLWKPQVLPNFSIENSSIDPMT